MSRNPTLVVSLVLAIGGSFNVVRAFRPSTVRILQPACRSSTCDCLAGGLRAVAPWHVKPRLNSRLNAKDRDSKLTSYPENMVEDSPQDDIYKQAIESTLVWVGLAVIFGVGLGVVLGQETAEEFFAGYLIEQSLSVDNLFVFLLLFEYFQVPQSSQNRVLNWGICGAVVMRALMIGVGAAALERFHAILLVFAGILIYSSAKTLIPGDEEEEEEDLNDNAIVTFSRNLFDSTDKFDGSNFFTTIDGVKMATPLFICMIALEISDVVFAVDSIPAVFGVTSNPLIVFTSNMFAIMGLRSLYTILSKAAADLKYLEPAVGIVLGFIGTKMVAEYFGAEVPTEYALAVVATVLSGGVGLSLQEKKQEEGAS